MAASSTAAIIVSCSFPAPPKQGAAAGVSVSSSHALRRACVAAAACTVIGMASGGGDMALALARGGGAVASRADAVPVDVALGAAAAAAVERPQAVPAVARQLAGEHRAGEPAPPVGAPEVQQRQAGAAEGPRARASSGGAVPGAAIRRGRLLHPLGKLGR